MLPENGRLPLDSQILLFLYRLQFLRHPDKLNYVRKMGERVETCRQWVGRLIETTRSSTILHKATSDPKVVIFGAGLLAVITWLLIRATKLLTKPQTSRPATPDLEKPAARSFKAPLRKPGG
jgi:hypothetical protein